MIFQGIPNRLTRIVIALPSEQALRDVNIGLRIILDIYVLGLMDKGILVDKCNNL